MSRRETRGSETCSATFIGGPTVLFELAGFRLLTDPTFDPAESQYQQGPISMAKLRGPALAPETVGPVDAVLLSHDQHDDNLDRAGRAFLGQAERVLTTVSGAQRLQGHARGLEPWESMELVDAGGRRLRITATPARHGPPGSEPFVGEVVGFVLEWEGQRDGALYLTGDTVWFEGIEEVARRFCIATAVLTVGSAHFDATGPMRYTLDAAEAVQVTRALGARKVVPIHFEGWAHYKEGREPLEQAFREAGLEERLLWLEPGIPTPLLPV